MARRKGDGHAGGHGWYVTFADLMGLLMAFFVMITAFSTMDVQKMKQALGSFKDAFGIQYEKPLQGAVIELDGLPVRGQTKNVAIVSPSQATNHPGPVEDTLENGPLKSGREFHFATAAATLRQALQDLPDVAEISRHIMVEDRPDGVAIQLMDQDGRSMFAEGSKEPYERTRRALLAVGSVLRSLPQRISISGHTSAGTGAVTSGYGPWELSADRANAVRALLEEAGVPDDRIYSVAGRADSEPLFPDNPYLAPNRRVTILLMDEKPPVPPKL